MADESLNNDGVQPDAPEDLQTLEQMIQADEAADAAKSTIISERDSKGRFVKDGASAKDAPRAGERLTPEEISAADAAGTKPPPKTTDSKGQPKTEAPAPAGGDSNSNQTEEARKAAEQAASDAGKSNYRKEVERRERSWQELNKQKEEFKQRQAEIDLREQTITAREAAVSRRGNGQAGGGFTAEQYEAAAPKFEARALEFEREGQFEKADEQRILAQNAVAAARELRAKMPAGGANGADTWQRLKADLPEALNVNSPLNQELRALIKTRPELLADEHGPYRAAVLAGRKMVAGLEVEVRKHQAEAAKVPGLLEQVQTLTARVQELEALTSPGGGGGALNRGRGEERSFASMSTAEQEASIERDLAHAL